MSSPSPEYGEMRSLAIVDSLLASQSNISGVSEILNGCLYVELSPIMLLTDDQMLYNGGTRRECSGRDQRKDEPRQDHYRVEVWPTPLQTVEYANVHSGSAFPATLALRIRELEPKGFKLDGVVTVIDCVNFRGYEDTSPSAKVDISVDTAGHMLISSYKHNTPTSCF